MAGEELAWRDRKGESFFLSPLYCGTRETGYSLCPPDDRGCDLLWMSSLNNLNDIPKGGKNQVIVADVSQALHFRIIDSDNKMVVDTSEKMVAGKKPQIEKLRDQLEGWRSASECTKSKELQVIAAVTSIVGYTCPQGVGMYVLLWIPSPKNLSEIPENGENLVIVAAVDKVLHFRIFDSGGTRAVDTSDEEEKVAGKKPQIEKLRDQLAGWRSASECTKSKKLKVIAAVTSIVRHTHEDSRNLTLGRAMSISGAAVDPNMGYLQSPMLTVFLTVLNARLGYWMERPRELGWKASGPTSGGGLLLKELLGLTDAKSKFVHLSDGGHFENLGVYELIRRRCRFIVALDSGEDGNPSNDNLTTLVRLCRIDFGVRIQINTDPLRMSGDGRLTSTHVVIGRVRYDDVDCGEKEGMLVYVKISLTGDEPPDLQGFAARNPDFPHEATDLKQSFDEERFEAYRNLGDHIARRVFQRTLERSMYEMYGMPLWNEDKSGEEFPRGNARLFGAVARNWSVPPALQSADYVQGTRDWIALQRDLLKNETLAPLAYELYPEFVPEPEPLEAEERLRAERAAFHAVGMMTQIMESAWTALNPNSDVDLPMNQGWLNAFRRWTTTRTFRRFWATYRSEFSPDFRQFCENSLHLEWRAPGRPRPCRSPVPG